MQKNPENRGCRSILHASGFVTWFFRDFSARQKRPHQDPQPASDTVPTPSPRSHNLDNRPPGLPEGDAISPGIEQGQETIGEGYAGYGGIGNPGLGKDLPRLPERVHQ